LVVYYRSSVLHTSIMSDDVDHSLVGSLLSSPREILDANTSVVLVALDLGEDRLAFMMLTRRCYETSRLSWLSPVSIVVLGSVRCAKEHQGRF
jgi:hypothetical protein